MNETSWKQIMTTAWKQETENESQEKQKRALIYDCEVAGCAFRRSPAVAIKQFASMFVGEWFDCRLKTRPLRASIFPCDDSLSKVELFIKESP